MAVYVPSKKLCFIHSPKTAGNSIHTWLMDNTDAVYREGTQHCNLDYAKKLFKKIDLSFCVVRNPWDWCVSWYHFQTQFPSKKKLEDKGFRDWLENTNVIPQYVYTQNVDIYLRLESLDIDFLKIQKILNCYEPLPFLNTTIRKPYIEYYKDESLIDLVYKKFGMDVEKFGYEY